MKRRSRRINGRRVLQKHPSDKYFMEFKKKKHGRKFSHQHRYHKENSREKSKRKHRENIFDFDSNFGENDNRGDMRIAIEEKYDEIELEDQVEKLRREQEEEINFSHKKKNLKYESKIIFILKKK